MFHTFGVRIPHMSWIQKTSLDLDPLKTGPGPGL